MFKRNGVRWFGHGDHNWVKISSCLFLVSSLLLPNSYILFSLVGTSFHIVCMHIGCSSLHIYSFFFFASNDIQPVLILIAWKLLLTKERSKHKLHTAKKKQNRLQTTGGNIMPDVCGRTKVPPQ